jgi:DNA (cytosine-5)-methyltransferase 3A
LNKAIGVKGIHINSSLVSAQNRKRIYWTNIGMEQSGLFGDYESIIQQPKDKGILLKDILQDNPNANFYLSEKGIDRINKYNNSDKCLNINNKSLCLAAGYYKQGRDNQYIPVDEKYFLSEKFDNWLSNHSEKKGISYKKTDGNRKAGCLSVIALMKGNLSADYIVHNLQKRSADRPSIQKNKNAGGSGHLSREDGKTYCLDIANTQAVEIKKQQKIRRLTPIECERLQTVADNYTNHVSDSQRYKMLGNGWTIDVIAHILKYIK